MRIFCLILFESSFSGSASINSLQMAPSSRDYCTSFFIKSLRLMVTYTFLDLVQSQLNHVDLPCSPRATRLKILFSPLFLVDFLKMAVSIYARWLYGFCALPCKRLYVRNTSFTGKRFLRTYMTCALEATCAYKYDFARKATYCIRIQLLRSRRLVCTSTTLRVKGLIAYVYKFCARGSLCIRVRVFT